MIRALFATLLRNTGKAYAPSPHVPESVLLAEMAHRACALARGMLRFRNKVFVERGVRVRGKGNLRLGRYVTLQRNVSIDAVSMGGVMIGERSKIGAHTIISCTSHLAHVGKGVAIGRDSGIGQFSFIGAAGGVTIGDNVIMGQYISFHAQSHVHADTNRPIREQGTEAQGITVESDVWVGAKATFLDGAHVRHGSIVAAGAVVRGEFPPYSIIGGVPAKILKSRLEA